ncbi:leucine-rich repeat protein, partial [Flammeovirga aprica]
MNKLIFTLLLSVLSFTKTVAQVPHILTKEDVLFEDGEIKDYYGGYSNIIIPKYIDGIEVTSIGDLAFYLSNLSSVDFSDLTSLSSIGENAFLYNNLSSVNLSNLTSLTSIGNQAFLYNKLSSVDFSDLTSLSSIGERAFQNNNLSSINLSNLTSLTSIGKEAFYGNNLSSVDIADLSSLTSIGGNAFAANSLLSYTLPTPNFNGKWNIDYSGKEVTHLNYTYYYMNSEPYELTSADVVFVSGEIKDYLGGYTNIVIPSSINGITVTSIGSGAFRGNKLGSVDLSNLTSLTSIGENAFRDNKLSTLDLSKNISLRSIGAQAFQDNEIESLNLEELTSLIVIGKFAFYYNYLRYFLLPNPDGDGAWNKGVSGGVVSDRRIAYYFINDEPYEITSEDIIFEGGKIKDYLGVYTNIVIPNSIDGITVTSIGENAFRENNLSSVDFSNLSSLTSIGDYAFYQNHLSSLDLSNSPFLTSIGREAFRENNLSSVDFSNLSSLTSISDLAFNKNNLSNVDFSNLSSLTSIGRGAFRENNLSSVDFSDLSSLISIDKEAFYLNSLSSFKLPIPIFDGRWSTGSSSGEEVTDLRQLYYYINNEPYEITSADVIFEDGMIKGYLGGYTNIVIPNSIDGITVTSIGPEAFRENNLSSVDFSNLSSLISIGKNAFSSNRLSSVDFSNLSSLTVIGPEAFSSNRLSSVDFSNLPSLTTIGFYAFYKNELNSVNFSNLSSLISIGDGAFESNYISGLDLSDLLSLQLLGRNSFNNNSLSSFILPTAQVISGVEFDGWVDGENNKYPNSSTVTNLDVSYSINIVANNNVIVSTRFQTETGDIIISGDDEKLFEDMRSVSFFVEKGKNITITPEVSGLPDGYYYAPVSLLVEEDIDHIFDNLLTIEYSITYESNAGTHANEESYTIESSEITFTSATKLGYSFEGWYSEPEFTNKVESLASGSTGDVTLYAKYSPIEYSITYESNAGTHTNEESYTIESSEITFTSATKLGYSFEGWYSEPEFTNKVESIASGSIGDVTLYAKYSPIEYSITYESNAGTHANEESYTIESSEITLTSATKLGYTFEGWYSDSEFTNKVASITSGSTGDVTLYAKFTPESYTITYNTDGGEHSNLESYTIESSEITLSEATKLGYTFEGWYSDSEFTTEVTSITTGSTGNVTLFAKYRPVNYSITYEADGGNHSNPSSFTVESSEIILVDGEKTGYNFDGWYSDVYLTNGVESIASGSTGDVTLYSKYSPIEYSITYESNAGLHTNA